jgi:hypothetical protein
MQVTVEPDASSFNYRLELTAILSNGSVGKTEKLQLKLRDSSNHEQLIPIPITVKRTDDE